MIQRYVKNNSYLKGQIARRLIIAVILFSSLITLVITASQLYSDYVRDINQINIGFEQAENTHIKTLTSSIWIFDENQVDNILNGMISGPDMERVEISVNGEIKWSTGEQLSSNTITKIIPLVNNYRDEEINVGELRMIANLDHVYARLWDKAVFILVANALKTFMVAGFMLILVYYMITRHLTKIIEHVSSHKIDKEHAPLSLDREKNITRMDELDELVNTVNSANIKLVGSYKDLKKSEQVSRDKERLFRMLVESSSAIPWELDLTTFCFTYVGPQAETILGYPVEDWYKEDFWTDHIHPDDRDEAIRYCTHETQLGKDHSFEYRTYAADGRLIWIKDDVGVVLKDSKPDKLQGYMFDITAHKQAQKILQHNKDELEGMVDIRTNELIIREAQYQLLADNVADGIFIHDDEGRIIECNRHIINNLGYTEEELKKTTVFDIDTEIRVEQLIPILKSNEIEQFYLFETMHRRKDGTEFPVEVKRTFFNKGQLKYFISVVRDVSARKKIEAEVMTAKDEAESANNAKSEFLARMSHELRTPLNAILGFSQLLDMNSEKLDKDQKDGVRHIVTGGKHLLKLIDEVLDIAKVDAGEMEIALIEISLDKAIHDSLMFVRPMAEQNKIQIIEPQDCNTCVYADEQRLKQVLVNLLSNAIKYNQQGGTVTIDIQPVAGDFVRISIVDTGVGIKPEDQHLLYEPFKRVGNSASSIKGAGIGLSITQKLLDLMNGCIGFDSQYGEGSTFWIELPLAVQNIKTKNLG